MTYKINANIRVRQSATTTFAAWNSLRGFGRALAGAISIVALLVPISIIPGLVVLVLPAEVYLFDWVYSEVKRTKNKGPVHSKALEYNETSAEAETEKERIVTQRVYPPFAA